MAIVYPSASGNWSDTSLWMEVGGNPYNQIPQVDDVVYLNGCTMTVAAGTINLGTNGEIRNDGDDGQGIVNGGNIVFSATGARTFIANFYVFDNIITMPSNNTGRWQLRIDGNIYLYDSPLNSIPQNGGFNLNYLINGDVTIYGSVNDVIFTDRQGSGSSFTINGNIYSENSCTLVRTNFANITIVGDMTGDIMIVSNSPTSLIITGDLSHGSSVLAGGATTLTYTGSLTQGSANLFSANITTFNMNGTLNQGTGQIASYITTLNLDGTLNLSGTRPFTTGVQNLNVATGGSVTYDNHLYYCFTNIVAVDSNFTITCRNQNLDNFDFKNKNLLNNTYPAQANVSDGYVYGLEDQFTGSYQLPPESVVLEGTPYGSHVGTLTLDISSGVQDTIDDIDDNVSVLLEEQPPIVKVLSASQISATSATINLSTQNTGTTTTKTGVDLDIDWNFTNPLSFETAGVVSSINVTGLSGSSHYYVRGWVLDDEVKVFSKNIISLQLYTLLLPPELQLCEYISNPSRSGFINTDLKFSQEITIKFKLNGALTNVFFFGKENSTVTNSVGSRYVTGNILQIFAGNGIYRQVDYNTDVNTIKISNNKIVFNNTEFDISTNYTDDNISLFSGGGSSKYNCNIYSINEYISCYIKSGENYIDNKSNICSAGVAGFYDTINHIFYTNDGSGALGHGNDIL